MPKELREAYLEAEPHPGEPADFLTRASSACGIFLTSGEHNAQHRRGVLPVTDHMAVTKRTKWLVPMVSEFLDTAMPEST
jgi:hypothetical protein